VILSYNFRQFSEQCFFFYIVVESANIYIFKEGNQIYNF